MLRSKQHLVHHRLNLLAPASIDQPALLIKSRIRIAKCKRARRHPALRIEQKRHQMALGKAGNTRSARAWSNATVECTDFSMRQLTVHAGQQPLSLPVVLLTTTWIALFHKLIELDDRQQHGQHDQHHHQTHRDDQQRLQNRGQRHGAALYLC